MNGLTLRLAWLDKSAAIASCKMAIFVAGLARPMPAQAG